MKSSANTVSQYLDELSPERKEAISKLREEIKSNLPKGFEEVMGYGMIGYVVPHALYPQGYHCDSKSPLPFINIASQKSFIAVYHMGLYADKKLLNWFEKEFTKASLTKLDMGKSCIRFKKTATIPFKLMGVLAGKISVAEWINIYETNFVK